MTLEAVASLDTLRTAFEQVYGNRGAPGPDRRTVEEVNDHLEAILPALGQSLLDGSYRPGLIRRVWIPKSGGGGQRGLGIPNVIDRIVAQSVNLVMTPNYDSTFHDSSHAFRLNHSCHTAIAAAQRFSEEGREWVIDLDLEKFFDRVNHDRLLAKLAERIKDRRLLALIRQMLKAKVVMPDGVVVSNDEGTPQGGPLSPLLSNIVLDELDWELTRRGHSFVRYADDCNIYVHSERAGQRAMISICKFIEKRLRLKVNQEKSAVAKPEERHFLGFRIRRNAVDGTVDVLLSRRSKTRIDEKIRTMTPRNWGQSLRGCLKKLNVYLLGWFHYFKICTTPEKRTFEHLDAHIRRRLRAILLRQWRRKRSIVRRLCRFGVKKSTAWKVYSGSQRCWALSVSTPVHRGLRNAYFAERGLLSLGPMWELFDLQQKVIAPKQLTLNVDS
jgi:group II intron reverse transcriptase/maturase